MKTVVLTKLDPKNNPTDKQKAYSREAVDVCRRMNLNPTTFEYFPPETSSAYFNSLNFKHFPNMKDVYSRDPNALSRFLTHWKCWQDCMQTKEPHLIVDYNGYQITEIPGNLEDLFVHALHLSIKADHAVNIVKTFKPTLIVEDDGTYRNAVTKGKISFLEYEKMRENFIPNVVAYAIKPAGVRRLATFVAREGAMPIDVMLNGAIINLQYTTMPFFTKNIE